MKNFTAIRFTVSASDKTIVVADRYVAHDLYVRNNGIIESLGGEILKGVGGFQAKFAKPANAKKFIKQAVCEISAEEYAASRKKQDAGIENPTPVAEGNKTPETADAGIKNPVGKGKRGRKGKGNDAPTSAVQSEEVKQEATPTDTPELTPAQQKALAKMRMSILNRAASAYSIANGGQATTFSALGKSEQELEAYLPNAKAGLLKSPKWASAVEKHGLTEAMLG